MNRLDWLRENGMDTHNRVIQLCLAGSRAEFEGRIEAARDFYRQAWEAAGDDYEACVAAHYRARRLEDPQECLRWNQEALARAQAVGDARVQGFYPSLYLNLGQSYAALGDQAMAKRYYLLAAELGVNHIPDSSTAPEGESE
jgi:tetratricopeptide (TPR) repeat protein